MDKSKLKSRPPAVLGSLTALKAVPAFAVGTADAARARAIVHVLTASHVSNNGLLCGAAD